MKNQINLIIIAVVFLFVGVKANAQQSLEASPTPTTVNLILSDVLSFGNGSAAAGGEVNFNYETASDYLEEKAVVVANSLIVTSSRAYNVNVKAEGTHFVNGENGISVGVLNIAALDDGSTMSGQKNDIALSTDDQVLVAGAGLGAEKELSIKYYIKAEDASSDEILGKPAGTYTQEVKYTATAL